VRAVAVFCGSSDGNRHEHASAAAALGRCVASSGLTLVYGGGNVGLMRVLADAALEAGGRVVGVIPEHLVSWERAHRAVTELHIVSSMHERKALMASKSDAFVAMPGGFGTFEEFFEALTWSQLGIHGKPCGLLNVCGYYDHLIAMFDRAVQDGFVAGTSLPVIDNDPQRLLDSLRLATARAVSM
jgi:uncharacterized protein (TIGR00730 family)